MRRVTPLSINQIDELNAFIHGKDRTVAECYRGQALLMLHSGYDANAIKMLVDYDKNRT